MMEGDLEKREDLMNLLRSCDKDAILKLIHAENGGNRDLFKNVPAYHIIVESLLSNPDQEKVVTQLVYLLTLHGANINTQDKNGDTALMVYLREDEDQPSDDVLQAFLRCGSDLLLKNKTGKDVLEYVLHSDDFSRPVKTRILEYMPGIWRAVEADDAMTVRRLINQWCSVHVEKDDLTVLQLAFNKGTENIIRVISGIGSTMDLVHAVLAGDVISVKSLLKPNTKYNINLKNMGDRGTTPVFYAMCDNNYTIVDLLLKHGARLDIAIQGENEQELPLYFAALSRTPSIHTDILLHTIPRTPISVDQLYYKGQNVIFYCIESNIEIDLFEAILHRCSASVLTQHIQAFQDSLNARLYAQKLGRTEYVEVIDKVVHEWCSDDGYRDNRNILAVHGFQFKSVLNSSQNGSADVLQTFLQMLPDYEDYKSKLCQAVEDGDLISVKEMLYSESWSQKGLICHFASSRKQGDGQPLLHKAVLRGHLEIVRELTESLVYKCNVKLDSVKDQYFRTAYHYAHGMEDGKELVFLLEDLGMSEFAMDKDGRSPIAFKDRKGQKEMNDLILYQTLQDFSEPEPDPWTTPLPLPIVGYLRKCLHEHHHGKDGHSVGHHRHGKLHHMPKHDAKLTAEGVTSLNHDHDHDHMYSKLSPQDFYQTKSLLSNTDKPARDNQKNGEIRYQTDHYQILDTNNPNVYKDKRTDNGNNNRDYDQNNADANEDDDDFEEDVDNDVNGDGKGIFVDTHEAMNHGKVIGLDKDLDDIEVEVESSDESLDEYSSHDRKPLLNESDVSESSEENEDVSYRFDEEYDGDYSDLESEDEKENNSFTNYCAIL